MFHSSLFQRRAISCIQLDIILGLLLCMMVDLKLVLAQGKSIPGQVAQIMTIGIDGSDPKLVLQTPLGFQAPNWTPDGKWLICNGSNAL